MNLNLIQLLSGTATFAEPDRPLAEATKGTVVSIPESEWIEMGTPTAISVSPSNDAYEVREKVSTEPAEKPSIHRYGYPASAEGSYL